MKKNMKYTIIIPSLNPNNKLLELVCELIDNGFKDIIVINDGSSSEYDNIFEELPKSIKLIKNEINLGKGASIKKAISCIKNSDAFITVDSDGQHLVKDVIKIKEELNNNDIVLEYETTAEDIEEWDSLTHIQIIKAAEDIFSIKFTAYEITSWIDIEELVDCIAKKLS